MGRACLPRGRGEELLLVHAVGDDVHVGVAVLARHHVLQPTGDHDLVQRQAVAAVAALLRQPREDFVALHKVDLGALGGRQGGDPLRRLPPSGDDEVGIGHVAIEHRALHGQHDVGQVQAVQVRQRALGRGRQALALQHALDLLLEAGGCWRLRDQEHLVPLTGQPLGVDGHDADAPAHAHGGQHKSDLHSRSAQGAVWGVGGSAPTWGLDPNEGSDFIEQLAAHALDPAQVVDADQRARSDDSLGQ